MYLQPSFEIYQSPACIYTADREIYQSPACIYTAERERSINRPHVYTQQTKRSIISDMYIHSRHREVYQSPACIYNRRQNLPRTGTPTRPPAGAPDPPARYEAAAASGGRIPSCRTAARNDEFFIENPSFVSAKLIICNEIIIIFILKIHRPRPGGAHSRDFKIATLRAGRREIGQLLLQNPSFSIQIRNPKCVIFNRKFVIFNPKIIIF